MSPERPGVQAEVRLRDLWACQRRGFEDFTHISQRTLFNLFTLGACQSPYHYFTGPRHPALLSAHWPFQLPPCCSHGLEFLPPDITKPTFSSLLGLCLNTPSQRSLPPPPTFKLWTVSLSATQHCIFLLSTYNLVLLYVLLTWHMVTFPSVTSGKMGNLVFVHFILHYREQSSEYISTHLLALPWVLLILSPWFC